MKRVVFALDIGEGWLGGVNYYRNLLSALADYARDEIEPIVLIPKGTPHSLIDGFPDSVKMIETSLLKRYSPLWFIRAVLSRSAGRDYALAFYIRYVLKERVVSHGSYRLKCLGLRVSAWIADLQHKHLPHFFSEKELSSRDRVFEESLRLCDVVILSSKDAACDVARNYPQYKEKAEVLRFVPKINFDGSTDDGGVLEKYGIQGRYFFMPNQYWIHKNHMAVLKALAQLKREDKRVLVVSTGSTSDYRAPGYFDEIQQFIIDSDLGSMYKILGVIPYADVHALAARCHAYLNPSLFEGWSTTVEEAKYSGKPILLSDLDVHKEQAPARGAFFDRGSVADLADKMWEMWNTSFDAIPIDELKRRNEEQRRAFAMRYCEIMDDLIGQGG